MKRISTTSTEGRYVDFSDEVIGGVSDYGLRSRHLRLSDNLLGRPKRALGAVRNGYQEAQNSQPPGEPTSLNKLVARPGVANRVLIHCKTGVGTGELVSIAPGTAGYTLEAMPAGYNVTDQDWDFSQLNYTLYATQTNDAQLPVMYESYGGGYHFDPMRLNVPTMLPPVGTAASAAGVGVDVGYHWYRIRYVYRNGASKAGPAFPVGGIQVPDTTHMTINVGDNVTVAPVNQPASLVPPAQSTLTTNTTVASGAQLSVASTATIKVGWAIKDSSAVIPAGAYIKSVDSGSLFTLSIAITGSSPSSNTLTFNAGAPGTTQDFLGWYLERTKINTVTAGLYTGAIGSTAIPSAAASWWVVTALGTSSNYTDVAPDASLITQADDTLYGDPPHMDGIISFKDRLWGWSASNLYVSQSINDANASGPCNWNALWTYFIGSNDGDIITSARVQYDRLIVMKTRSVHAIEGSTPGLDIRVVDLAKGPGCVGRRASAIVAHTVYMLGDTGFHTLMGNMVDYSPIRRPRPQWGKIEVSHYLDDMNPALRSKCVMTNIAGEFLSVAYASSLSQSNDQEIIYDFQMHGFRHFTNRRIRDSYVQFDNDLDFGGATMLWIDPVSYGVPNSGYDQNPAALVWGDSRAGTTNYNVFAQSISGPSGASKWTSGGVQIGTAQSGTSADAWDVCTDGGSGWFVAFGDKRTSTYDLYLIRVDAFGNAVSGWSPSGLLLRTGTGSPVYGIRCTPDGVGGVVVIWFDLTAQKFHVQRITATGTVLFTAGGVNLPTGAAVNPRGALPNAVGDGTGGVYLSMTCVDNLSNLITPAHQHVDGTGAIKWGGGTAIQLTGVDNAFRMAPDGSGGVYLTGMTGSVSPSTVRVWRVNADGSYPAGWTSAGIIVSATGTSPGAGPAGSAVVSDGAGGVIVAWLDERTASAGFRVSGVYAQRYNSSGSPQWTAGGALVSTPPFVNGDALTVTGAPLVMVQDGSGGAILTYIINLSPSTAIVTQGVNSLGAVRWSSDAQIVNAANAGFANICSCTDGAGGAIVAWQQTSAAPDIYAQRISTLGFALWGTGGIPIATAVNAQVQPRIVFTATPVGQFPPSLSPAYRFWRSTTQYLDAVLSDGTGGVPIRVRGTTPFLDDGLPDYLKDLQRIQLLMDGALSNVTATVYVDRGDGTGLQTAAVTFGSTPTGTILGDESATVGVHDLVMANEDGSPVGYGSDVLASDASDAPFAGIEPGTKGKRYQWEFNADATDAGTIYGFVVDGVLDPERSYS